MSRVFRRPRLLCITLCIFTGLPPCAQAGPGTSGALQESANGPAPIVLGMSTALSGPTAYLGQMMHAGVMAAIEEANRAGGIRGRRVELIALDDAYEPALAAPNMRRLTEELKVLAVVGNVGTPTAVAATPIAMETKTPFWGAYTGAAILRKDPPERYVFNFRASYAEETATMINGAVREFGIRPEEIAFFTQRDAFGDAVFGLGVNLLRKSGLNEGTEILHVRYTRNSLAVENAVADLLLHEPEPRAVILVASPAPAVKFARLVRTSGCEARLLGMSFLGAERFAEQLGALAEGTVFTQVVPDHATDLPIASEFRKAMTEFDNKLVLTSTSFEGYIATRIFFQALESIEHELERESVVEALEGMGSFDSGLGAPLFLGPGEHQACHTVWPAVLQDGRFVPLDWQQPNVKEGN